MYHSALARMYSGGFSSGTLRILLVDSDYTFDAAHDTVSDVVANELSATSYARQNLPALSTTQNGDVLEIDHADVAFGDLGGASNDTIGGAVVYDETGADDTAYPLLAFFDVADLATNGGSVTFAPASPSMSISS